jgi:hypothetical protein
MYCNVMSPAGRKRKGKNDNLVPVTFPVKEAFPHKQISLKPLLASLELWRDSNEIFGMPKGGLGPFRPPMSTNVLPAAFHLYSRPPSSSIIRCYLPITVSEKVSATSIALSLQASATRQEDGFRPPR